MSCLCTFRRSDRVFLCAISIFSSFDARTWPVKGPRSRITQQSPQSQRIIRKRLYGTSFDCLSLFLPLPAVETVVEDQFLCKQTHTNTEMNSAECKWITNGRVFLFIASGHVQCSAICRYAMKNNTCIRLTCRHIRTVSFDYRAMVRSHLDRHCFYRIVSENTISEKDRKQR